MMPSGAKSGQSHPSNQQLCLNQISSLVISIIKSKQITTFQEVTDLVLAQTQAQKDSDKDRTSRRRIYDVINVCVAAGIVRKENRNIIYQPTAPNSEEAETSKEAELYNSCNELTNGIISKLQIFLLYKSLIERNQNVNRPPNAVQLPAIFVGFPSDKGESNLSLDGKDLEIQSDQDPTFYSPVDVFHAAGISIDQQRNFLRCSPPFNKFESYLFPQE